MVKSITVRKNFTKYPEVKLSFGDRKFWLKGFYVNTVGRHGDENTIKEYVKKSG